jgi:hypothetical protein
LFLLRHHPARASSSSCAVLWLCVRVDICCRRAAAEGRVVGSARTSALSLVPHSQMLRAHSVAACRAGAPAGAAPRAGALRAAAPLGARAARSARGAPCVASPADEARRNATRRATQQRQQQRQRQARRGAAATLSVDRRAALEARWQRQQARP